MRLNAGIITSKLLETEKFYTQILDFELKFENEFYLLLTTPNKKDELAFLLPNHPSQNALFHPPYNGNGLFLTIEVHDVDAFYNRMKSKRVDIKIDIKDEPWGDRHFALVDPNGIAIDIVKYQESN